MIKILKNKYLHLIVVLEIMLSSQRVLAGTLESAQYQQMNAQADALRKEAHFAEGMTLGMVIANVVKAFLSLLGIIFVVLMVWAGYNWMTAGGEEEKVNKAKNTIRRALIGIVIIIASYAITYFVFNSIQGIDAGPT